ncbi:MAG: hypothetical protein JOZ70_03140 [Pseudolabrys sp.]|nr:hypothetical protein [Pseudolabrys sp.]
MTQYRIVLILPLLMAAADLAAFVYTDEEILLIRTALDLGCALGLWLQRGWIRYAAAAYFALSLLFALLPLLNAANIAWAGAFVWIAVIGIASGAELYLLLISKELVAAPGSRKAAKDVG